MNRHRSTKKYFKTSPFPNYLVKNTGRLFLVFLLALGLAACGGSDSSSGNNGDSEPAAGFAQKGPFKPGASVSAVRLADDGSLSSDSVTTTTSDNGAFVLPEPGWSGPARITIGGVFYDEFHNGFSDEIVGGALGSAELHGVARLPAEANANINLFTHLVSARTLRLMSTSTAFDTAREQARNELAAIVGIASAPNSLNLQSAVGNAQWENDSANLLLFSAAALAAGTSQASIDDIANDIADDGQINGVGVTAFNAIKDAAKDNDDLLANARDNLLNMYGIAPPNHTGGQFPAWVPVSISNPVAVFSSDGLTKVGEVLSFNAGASIGDGLTYAWSFGDGSTAAGVQTTHTYAAPDDYTVTLTVTDSETLTHSINQQLTITSGGGPSADPVAAFTPSGSLRAGEPQSFDAGGSSGDSLIYAWDFGDGTTGSGVLAAHTYADAGDYTVTLTVTDSDSRTDSFTRQLTITAPTGDTGEVITLPYENVATLTSEAEDLYSFTGQAGQFIGVQAGLAVSGSSFSGTVSLTTKSGQAVDTVISSIGFSSSRSSAVVAKLPANGEYLIKVKASNEPGDYWLDVKEVPSVAIDENIEGTLQRGKSSLLRTFQGTVGTVIATTNTTSDSVIFNVVDMDGNTILRKSPSSSSDSGRSQLPADGTYVLRMIARSSLQPTSYKTAVAGVELPQPLSFDSAGRATVTGDMQVYGDYHYYSFTAAPGDGVFARLETDGTDGVQQAMVRVYTPNQSHTALQQLTKNYYNSPSQDTLAGLSADAVPPVLDNVGARLFGNSGGQTHLLAVHVEEVESGRALGGYTVRLDRVKAGSTIVIDDDLNQCPGADGHSVRAAAYAIEAGGTIDVCNGHYAEHLPINNRYQTGFTIKGRSQAGVLLKNESGKLVVNNAYSELLQLDSLTLIGAPLEDETSLASGVSVKDVTVDAAPGSPNADNIGPLYLADNAVVDGLSMRTGEFAIIAKGDNISIRNSSFNGVGGRIDWEGDNAVFENNIVVAQGDDVDGRPFIFSIEGTGAQVRDNAFTLTGDQNTKRHAITVANTGDPYTGGENASPTVVSGNIVTSSSGGLTVVDFDLTVEQNFVKLTAENGGSAFVLSTPRYIRNGDVTHTVKALIRNNVFDGISNSTGSANPNFSPVVIWTGTPYLTTDINVINNTFRVAADYDHPDNTGRYDRRIIAVRVNYRYVDAPNEALSVRMLNNIITGWGREDVRVDDEFTKAIWIPEDFTIEGSNNLFSKIDVPYAGGGRRSGGGDVSGNPLFVNGLLEVSDASLAVNNGLGQTAGGPPIPDVDYDGTPRPQNGNYDIGAHENEY